MERDLLLSKILSAEPLNEAEVETKILLHIFHILGFSDDDRGDKRAVTMYFGREKKSKIADFVLFNGKGREFTHALVAVEAKAPTESIEGLQNQVISYATWLGTPLYIGCNGKEIIFSRILPGAVAPASLSFQIANIAFFVDEMIKFCGRTSSIVAKESIALLKDLTESDFPADLAFLRYREKLQENFAETSERYVPLTSRESGYVPQIPISVSTFEDTSIDSQEFLNELLESDRGAFVVGAPGVGKSTLCKRLALALAKANKVPLYIHLANQIPNSIQEALENCFRNMNAKFYPQLLKTSVHQIELIVLLDGLDEMRDLKVGYERIKSLVAEVDNALILMTTRPEVPGIFIDDEDFAGFSIYQINPLNNKDLNHILSGCNLNVHQAEDVTSFILAHKIPETPMLILMLARLSLQGVDLKNQDIYKVYERYVFDLYEYYNGIKVEEQLSLKIMEALFRAAKRMQKSTVHNHSISLTEMNQELTRFFGKTFVERLLNTGLIFSENGQASFIHKSFLDFAISWNVIHAIKSRDYRRIVRHRSSDFTLGFVASRILPEDFAYLKANLFLEGQGKRPYVRFQRLLAILLEQCNPVGLMPEIYELFPRVEDSKSRRKIIGWFVRNRYRRFMDSFFEFCNQCSVEDAKSLAMHIFSLESNERKEFLALGISSGNGRQFIYPYIKSVSTNPSPEELFQIQNSFQRMSDAERIHSLKLLKELGDQERRRTFLISILTSEVHPRVLVHTLYYLGNGIEFLTPDLVNLVVSRLLLAGRRKRGSVGSDKLHRLKARLVDMNNSNFDSLIQALEVITPIKYKTNLSENNSQ